MFAMSVGDTDPYVRARQVLHVRAWAVGYLSGPVQNDQGRAGAVGGGLL